MSSTDDFPYTVAQQKEQISSDLNSTFLFQFLFGTFIRGQRSRFCPCNSLHLLLFAWNWFYTNTLACTSGTRMEMFIESISEGLISEPESMVILLVLSSYLSFLIADGLLVWRCFHACGQSLRKTSLPIALFIVESGLLICMTVYTTLVDVKPRFLTHHTSLVSEYLDATLYVSAALTSIVSTYMICREIHRRTKSAPSSRTKKTYQTIIDALIQSSALYSAVAIIDAVLSFGSAGKFQISYKVELGLPYVGATIDVVIGLAPTLMVASLFISRPKDHVSDRTVTDQDMCQGDVEMQLDGAPGSGEAEEI
ncbi:hypothetical protein CPC08DRAFT_730849 [Agrocybe pediades]|nr:hypothetical protein CPC08DRAFT_730849 [Agrocybe pediades]